MIDLNTNTSFNYLNNPLADAMRFYDDCRARNLTHETANQYKSFAYDFVKLTRPPLNKNAGYQDFKPALLEFNDYLKSKDLTYETQKVAFTALNGYFSYLMDEDAISTNPVPQFRARYIRTYKRPDTPTVDRQRYRDAHKRLTRSALGCCHFNLCANRFAP